MDFKDYMQYSVAKCFNIRPPKGDVGIEIETEGEGLPAGILDPHNLRFEGKQDGSLRNGMEYVSAPLLHREVEQQVNLLQATLGRLGARLDPTYRSSTHIHLNMCEHTLRDVVGMMVLWACVEPICMRLMPPGRDGSLFCMSGYDCGDLAIYMDRLCKDIATGFSNGFRPRGKYSSLNITRLGTFDGQRGLGTLEFRIFPTSMDGGQIAEWCQWLLNLRQIVTEYQREDGFIGLVREAEQTPLPFVRRIFGRLPLDEQEIPGLMDFGAKTAYEVARIVNKHWHKKPKANRKDKKDYGIAVDEFIENIDQFFEDEAV